jgi:hypothetical protein
MVTPSLASSISVRCKPFFYLWFVSSIVNTAMESIHGVFATMKLLVETAAKQQPVFFSKADRKIDSLKHYPPMFATMELPGDSSISGLIHLSEV